MRKWGIFFVDNVALASKYFIFLNLLFLMYLDRFVGVHDECDEE